jgi:hypothetical protein
MYCVKFLGSLWGKFGFLTEGKSEGLREQAKPAILANAVWTFAKGNEGNEGLRSGGGQSPLFP